MVKKIFPFLIVLSISIFASWGFLTPGFVPTHDGEYHIIRLWQFDEMAKSGDFFPRWAPDLNSGFGVPLFNFFYPLPNYIGELFHYFLGFSFIDSVKLTLATGMIFGSVFFYFWLKSIFGVWAGIVGSIFYTLAPYHLVDLYVRGTPGEIWALAFFPAVLWAIEKRSFLGGFFLALLILSHNILALIFMPFLISYMLLKIFISPKVEKRSVIYHLSSVICFGFALSAFFWLPALIEAKYVTGLKIVNFADHFPAFFQLIFPSWGTGFSVPGIADGMSFQIGVPHLLIVIASLFFLRRMPHLPFFLSWFMIILFLLLETSLPVWKLIPALGLIQYPWRLLSLVILLTSFMAGSLAFLKKSKIFIALLILLPLFFYSGYTKPVKYLSREDSFYLNNPNWTQGTATLGNSFSTIWLPFGKPKKEQKLEIVSGKVEVKKADIKPQTYFFQLETATPAQARVNTSYFPGWKVLVNEEETKVDFSDGLINFKIPKGESIVKIKFINTPIRFLANIISLLGLVSSLTLGILFIVKSRANK